MQNSQTDEPADDWSAALDALAERHYAVIPGFLCENLRRTLREELDQLEQDGRFHAAGIGRGQHKARIDSIRGDRICWLEEEFPAGGTYLRRMAALREALNRSFYLGLQSFEAHYAHYQPGSFYQRHVDRHRDNDARVVSSVCYLNQDWPADAGGELRLFDADNRHLLTLPPEGGTLVLFMSADMPHEVLPALRARYSLAGWFRRDAGS